ncbi:aspartate--tRNA(Asn) ligase [Bariatricus sp. SGI.154]|uniref:aspartate--tRNA(Asn) ligase n=1 Tax=Bariatricus sp. SGI.154 TaxID=3420549 RepID=UPI003D02026F
MEYLTGVKQKETMEISQLLEEAKPGQKVKVNGAVHTIRDMGTVAFVILRKREGLLQGVYEEGIAKFDLKDIEEAATIEVEGVLEENEKAPNGIEIRMETLRILSEPEDEMMPLAISKWRLNTSLEAKLNYRSIALRNVRERAKFRIQEGLTRAFRDFLYSQGFTEIHTPKIGAKGAEGGANIFKLDYFHRPAVLAQSPQFYKQMMVGVFDRVFETAPVFRAEKHNTKRHLNEYTSLDFEMGYIDGFEDIMGMETGYLQYAMELLGKEYAKELQILGVELPKVDQIPAVHFRDIKEKVSEKYGHKMRNPFDLEPEEEQLISQYAKEEWDSDFVFVTHYPSKKRPFYAMDDPEDTRYTLSFDLLFRGMEITTGGQRIHDYKMLTEKIAARGMSEEGMEQYLNTFKHGMPPHGGLGIGLERLTMKLIGEDNVRETTLFPRDLSRLEP